MSSKVSGFDWAKRVWVLNDSSNDLWCKSLKWGKDCENMPEIEQVYQCDSKRNSVSLKIFLEMRCVKPSNFLEGGKELAGLIDINLAGLLCIGLAELLADA